LQLPGELAWNDPRTRYKGERGFENSYLALRDLCLTPWVKHKLKNTCTTFKTQRDSRTIIIYMVTNPCHLKFGFIYLSSNMGHVISE